MNKLLGIIPVILYFITGIISLIMTFHQLFSKKFMPFQENASGIVLESLGKPLQLVILTILRIAGLGFLIEALLLTVFPAVNYFYPDEFLKYSVPIVALIYSSGLALFNYDLYKNTKAQTPWKGSFFAAIIIIAGIVISAFSG